MYPKLKKHSTSRNKQMLKSKSTYVLKCVNEANPENSKW